MASRRPRSAPATGGDTRLRLTMPVNGGESRQKKPAGMGSLTNEVCALPATVTHTSTPLRTSSDAPAALVTASARTRATMTMLAEVHRFEIPITPPFEDRTMPINERVPILETRETAWTGVEPVRRALAAAVRHLVNRPGREENPNPRAADDPATPG